MTLIFPQGLWTSPLIHLHHTSLSPDQSCFEASCLFCCALWSFFKFLTSAQISTMSVNLSTVQKWTKELDSLGEWLRYDESGGKVTRIFCALCAKPKDRLKAVRNLSASFICRWDLRYSIKERQCQRAPSIGHACEGSKHGAKAYCRRNLLLYVPWEIVCHGIAGPETRVCKLF